ncbi:MAG: 2-oxoacid:acceptor oxidoreductase family protein [Candidatus Lokiarchaeota archaeon]|nr:2-oxoacid:acceptor oxidoreductase family protein [Candidatus Lokiarchaeota archaeon]
MSDRIEVRFAGFGGQGIALMGRLVGETIALHEKGKTAIMTQSYGPESRGGASSSDVVIDTTEIDFPKATHYDYFVCMSEEAYTKYIGRMKERGVMFVEEDLVILDAHAKKASKIFKIPATALAETLGSKLYANICMLGYVCANTDLFKEKDFMKVMKDKVRARFIENNIKAFNLGKNHKG